MSDNTDPLSTDNGQQTTEAYETWRTVVTQTLPSLATQLDTLANHPLGG